MITRHTKLTVAGLLAAVLFAARLLAAEPTDPTKHYMGINLDYLDEYSGQNAFVDMFKQSRNWFGYNWTGNASVDSEDWPTQDCSNIVFGVDNALGVYKLVFEGKASSVSMLWTGGSVGNLQYNAATNTSTADVTLTNTNTGGLNFLGTQRTAASATNTGIRNVRLYRPGYPTDGSVVCTNEWLTIMRKFQVIRFMNWVNTCDNPMVSWSQRMNPFKSQPQYSDTINGKIGKLEGSGAAMEHIIQVCNAANADLWLNIPVLVDDDYLTKTAQLVLCGSDGRTPYTSPQANPVYPPLNPNLKVYLEYGNEIWNSIFKCGYWIQAITDSIIAVTSSTHPIVYDGQRNQWYSIARYAAWRTVGISTIFRRVFGDAAMMTRVRPVLEGQAGASTWFRSQELPFLEGFYATYRPSTDPHPNTNPHPVSYYIYGAGGAAYNGVVNWSADPNTFFAGGNYPISTWWWSEVAADAVWAGNYGLKRIAYEGGMGLDAGAGFTQAQMLALNADPRMKDLHVAYHKIWDSCGGDLLVYHDDIQVNNVAWEFTNSVYNPNSPKLQAIDKLRDTLSRTPVSLGGVVPCTTIVQDASPSIMRANGSYTSTVNGESVLNGFSTPGYWIAVPFTANQAGWYRLSVRCVSSNAGTVGLWINGANAVTRTVPNPLGNTAYITVQLKSGLNVVRLEVVSGGFGVNSIMLAHSDTVVGVAPRQVAGLKPLAITVKSASGSVVAHVLESYGGATVFVVYDAEGRRVAKGAIDGHAENLVLPRLARGVYFLCLSSKNPMAGHGAQNVAPMTIK